jgi:tetratricopeptide (TPR) repeat protein
LAVAYFQKGVCFWILGDYNNAIASFSETHSQLRSNNLIDYRQLGLNYTLFCFEVLFNRAICYFCEGLNRQACQDLEKAQRIKVIKDHEAPQFRPAYVERKFISGEGSLYSPFSVPPGLLYRPAENKIKNAKQVDYLGQSKVIASADVDDNFTGFTGAKFRNAITGRDLEPQDDRFERVNSSKNQSPTRLQEGNFIAPQNQLESNGVYNNSVENIMPLTVASPSVYAAGPGQDFYATNNLPASNTLVYSPALKKSSPDQNVAYSGLQYNTMGSNDWQGYDQGGYQQQSSPVRTASKVKVKCHFGGDTRVILFQDALSLKYDEILCKIREKYGMRKLKLKYKDEDAEMVLLTDQEDLEMALALTADAKMELYVFE